MFPGANAVKKAYDSFRMMFKGRDRTSLLDRVMTRYGWHRRRAKRAICRYWMFLFIAAMNLNVTLVPTYEIDCVWEEDILTNTEQYVEACRDLCGQLINHADAIALAQADDFQDMESAFEQTKTLFEHYFGLSVLGDSTSQPAACGRPGNSPHSF
jgi:hypothetical protein